MKRKRGKKGKSKKLPAVIAKEAVSNVVNLSAEDNSGEEDVEEDEVDSKMDIEAPSSPGTNQPEKQSVSAGTDQPEKHSLWTGTDLPEKHSLSTGNDQPEKHSSSTGTEQPEKHSSPAGTDQPEKLAALSSGGPIAKPAGNLVYNRVKVKIKSSKTLATQLANSDARIQSDTDKSSQQVDLDKGGVISDKLEDSANSVHEINPGASVYQSKKGGSITIKPSTVFSSLSLSPCSNSGMAQSEKVTQKEPDSLPRISEYNKQELNKALEVIKKVMKMDAAEPFNVPVDPVALGIPDYFDVIDTPMDFGTICSNLESGVKYVNSKHVYQDVQFIWDNCYKYNSKGDYIVDLMKRVKKNFLKHWIDAGLYHDQPQSTSGADSGKMSGRGGPPKIKSGKRYAYKKHKEDCMCAICVMIRRRKEREALNRVVDDKMEVDSPGWDTSSSMGNSSDQDADANLEVKKEEAKVVNSREVYNTHLQEKHERESKNGISLQSKEEGERSEHGYGEAHKKQHEPQMVALSDIIRNEPSKREIPVRMESQSATVERKKSKDKLDERKRAKIYDELNRRYENPMALELCNTLFSQNSGSVWSGRHSMVQRPGTARDSPIHAAIASFMKK